MTAPSDIGIRPIVGLVYTYEVTDSDGTVLGVIVESSTGDWRVISTRYGTPEPKRVAYPSRWAAALSITEGTE